MLVLGTLEVTSPASYGRPFRNSWGGIHEGSPMGLLKIRIPTPVIRIIVCDSKGPGSLQPPSGFAQLFVGLNLSGLV